MIHSIKKSLRALINPTKCLMLFCLFNSLAGIIIITPSTAWANSENSGSQALTDHFLSQQWSGDFDDMVDKHEIRVLVVYSKTFYFIDKGQQKGLSYDGFREFEKFVNSKLGKNKSLHVKIIFIPVKRDELIPKLVDGYGDIAAANLTITPQRREVVDFSDPFATGVKEVVVTGTGEKPMKSYDELSGREIYVRKSSSYYESLLTINRLFAKTGRKKAKLVMADESFEDEDLLEMLNAGLISTVIMDSHKAEFWTKIFDNIQIHQDAYIRSDGEIAWAFRKNSPKLEKIVNEFTKNNKKGTLFGNIIIKKYLRNTEYITNSVSKKELEKFERMVQLFQKYAGLYDFDFLMLAAQAYQESGLVQETKSPAGAIGVMQLLPSTARDPNVDIPDIHLLEKNIHAGAKYMRFIADRYFNNEHIDPVNKMLFSFAAYNAGPARVRTIRNKTAEMGLDPNIWFRNAEFAAAKIIGRETVQYVANIYKYYIAYRMVSDRLRAKTDVMKTTGTMQ